MRASLAAAVVTVACACGAHAFHIAPARSRIDEGARQAAVLTGVSPGEELIVVWLDPSGRIRGTWPVLGGARGGASVEFRARGAPAGRHGLAAVSADGRRAEASFDVIAVRLPPYLAVLEAEGAAGANAEELARELGLSAVAGPGRPRPTPALGWLAQILASGPQFLRLDREQLSVRRAAYRNSGVAELLARPACLHDRAWLEQVWRWYGPHAGEAARDRPWLHSLGRGLFLAEESGELDFCRSVSCMRAFSSAMRRRYSVLESLNARWGTAFRIWGEIRPATTAELLAALGAPRDDAALARLTSWCDHRGFMDRTWIDALRLARDITVSSDRRAMVGAEDVGLPGVFSGADAPRLLGSLDWASVQARIPDLSLARSFARPQGRILTELGANDPAGALWRGLGYGHRGCLLRLADGEEMSPSAREDLRRALHVASRGLSALLERASFQPDRIAVLHSQPSIRVEWALAASARGGGTRAGAAIRAWAQLFADIGIAPEFIDGARLSRRALKRRSPCVLVLPRAYCLSRKEVDAVVWFARSGGLVVADACPGLLEASCAPAEWSQIEDLFGIAPGRQPLPADGGTAEIGAPIALRGMDRPGAYVDGVDPDGLRLVERGLRSLGGYAHGLSGSTEGLLSNPFGRGWGVYLNMGLEAYPDVRTDSRGASMRTLVRNVLELAQLQPRIELLSGGKPCDGCDCAAWRLEETRICFVWRDPAFGNRPLDAELVFDWSGSGYVYDVREGVLLGSGRRRRVTLAPGGNVFAFLPYDVESISITPQLRGGVLQYRALLETSSDQSWTHVLHQQLLDRHGRVLPGSAATLQAERGVADGSSTFAVNEPAGEYALVIRDVVSGVEGALTLTKQADELEAQFPVRQE